MSEYLSHQVSVRLRCTPHGYMDNRRGWAVIGQFGVLLSENCLNGGESPRSRGSVRTLILGCEGLAVHSCRRLHILKLNISFQHACVRREQLGCRLGEHVGRQMGRPFRLGLYFYKARDSNKTFAKQAKS